jgi:phospholipid/cholesterol/gamma-HCH transport system permease protein
MAAEQLPENKPTAAASMERPPLLAAVLNPFGRLGIRLNNDLGAMAIFLARAVVLIFHPRQIPEIIHQVYFIGARSASIVALVGLFTGMVLGLQLYYVMNKFGAVGFLGTAVSLALIRELGPVLTAIMITARAGSAMTAEIGIQRISEQIDALTTMRIDPLGYLISPRIAAALISFPILTAFFDIIGILGGYLSGVILMGANAGAYIYRMDASVEWLDVRDGFIKSLVFAVLVITLCCFQGYFTHMRRDSYGAKSVSLSTTSAVVLSCVMILVSDYVVTSFLL